MKSALSPVNTSPLEKENIPDTSETHAGMAIILLSPRQLLSKL